MRHLNHSRRRRYGSSTQVRPRSNRVRPRFEVLESRKVLAAAIDLAAIGGQVFDDFTGNGFQAGEEVAGATVELYRDNGNGVFDAGTDNRDATTVTASDGNYRFSRLTAGTYFIVQPAQTADGRTLARAVSPAIVVSSEAVTGRIVTTIDSFDQTTHSVRDETNDGIPVGDSRAAPEALGGERDIFVNKTSANGAIELGVNNPLLPDQLTFDSVLTGEGVRSVVWDGPDNDAIAVDDTGLSGIDLNDEALGVQLQIRADLAGGLATVRLYSDDGVDGASARFSSVTIPIPATNQNFLSPEFIPFTDFVATSGGGADLDNIGAIELEITGAADVNGAAELVGTVATNDIIQNFDNFETADLRLTKTASTTTPNVGENVTFTITVINDGPDTATGVTVSDPLPAGMTFQSVSPVGAAYNAGTGIWQLGTLANGQTSILNIVASTDTVGVKTNRAQISASEQFDPDSTPAAGDDGEDDSASVILTPMSADLSLTKTVNNPSPNPGETVAFVVTLANAGLDTATGIVVRDLLPTGLTFDFQTTSPGTTYTAATGNWSVPSLASGASVTLNVSAIVSASGSLVNTAEVIAVAQFDIDSTPANGVATEDDQDSVTLTTPIADLRLEKTVDNVATNVGQTATFTILVTNDGPNPATGVIVADSVPAGLELTGSSTANGNFANGQWTIPSIAVGQTVELDLQTLVNTRGTKTNTAQIIAADQMDSDSTPGNGVATEDDQDIAIIQPPEIDLSLSKSVNQSRVSAGDSITYSVVVSNDGPDTATNIQIRDVIPSNVTFTTQTPSTGGYTPADGIWNIPALAADTDATLRLTGIVTSAITTTNVAEVIRADQVDRDSVPGNDQIGEDDQDSAVFVATEADLFLTKTVDQATPDVGDTVRFTVTIGNDGPDTATGILVRDVLPAGLTLDGFNPSVGNFDAIQGEWSVPTLINTGTATLTLDAIVQTVGTLTNTAEIVAADQTDTDSPHGNNIATEDDQASATVSGRQIDLSVLKSVDNNDPTVGDEITFTVVLGNAGPSSATGIIVADALPDGLTLVRAVATRGTFNTTSERWFVDLVTSGGEEEIELVARVDEIIVAGVNVAEVVEADQSDLDSTPNNNDPTEDDQASVSFRTPVADLSLEKTVSNGSPNVGDRVIFTIQLTNDGPDDASGVIIEDILPPGFDFVSDSLSGGDYDETTGQWNLGNLGNGETATLAINADVTAAAQSINTARVIASSQVDPDSTAGNNVGSEDDQDTATVTPMTIDLSLTKTASVDRARVGETFDFILTIANAGPSDATAVEVEDILPDGLSLVSTDASLGNYDSLSGRWFIPVVGDGDQETLRLTVISTSFNSYANTAEVVSAGQFDIDSTPGNNLPVEDDQASATVASQSADLSITKTVDNASPNRGDEVTFIVRVTNGGPDDAASIVVADTLPTGLTLVRSGASRGDYDDNNGRWQIPSLDDGDSATLELVATVDSFDDQTNVAEIIASNQFDPDSTPADGDPDQDDRATASLSPQLIDLALTKTADQDQVDVGDTVRYTVTITNDGPDEATGVVIEESLSQSLDLESFQPESGIFDPTSGLWTIARIASGQSFDLTLDAIVNLDGVTAGTSRIENVAEILAADQTDFDSVPGNNDPGEDDRATEVINVMQADLSLQKRVSNGSPNLGEQVLFTLTLRNDGPDPATGIRVLDALPTGLDFVDAEATIGVFASNTGIWSVDSLVTGETATLQITTTVSALDVATNTAEIIASDRFDPDSTPGNNDATEDDQSSVDIAPQAVDIEVEVTVDNDLPVEEDIIEFLAVVRNTGNLDATSLIVSAPFPEGLTIQQIATTQGTYDATTGRFSVGDLDAGDSVTLTITALVTERVRRTFAAELIELDQIDRDSIVANNELAEDDQDAVEIRAPRLLNKRMFLAR